jgi:hypothetical protein
MERFPSESPLHKREPVHAEGTPGPAGEEARALGGGYLLAP